MQLFYHGNYPKVNSSEMGAKAKRFRKLRIYMIRLQIKKLIYCLIFLSFGPNSNFFFGHIRRNLLYPARITGSLRIQVIFFYSFIVYQIDLFSSL
jgi:hypothetical protein